LRNLILLAGLCLYSLCCSCIEKQPESKHPSEILGNADYPAICFGGYRHRDRSQAPTVAALKEDVLLLHAMGFRILRTYHTRLYDHTPRLLQAIQEIRRADPNFEMFVMLGVWIQCEGARTASPNHAVEDTVENQAEIEQALLLAQAYPDIIKFIAVGNESMVHWAADYFVQPAIVLRWVQWLQDKKKAQQLSPDIWITSSDNFASWGGGDTAYHNPDLNALITAVDYISVHTYPFHDTHYNREFWQQDLDIQDEVHNQIVAAMDRATSHAKKQYAAVAAYLKELKIEKPIHIGETGWASSSDGFYGPQGSGAADERKQKLYYQAIRNWTDSAGITCFFFEAFDEPWKDHQNPAGSENHFGLFTVSGHAKYALWDNLDALHSPPLGRNGKIVRKTFGGQEALVLKNALRPL
jgi:exo-beta-1,3-glucanase (GH17 family)